MRLRASRLGVASSGADIPLPRRVRSILSKYSASLLIPGASGVAVQTFSPGNFVESTGQTLTPVDGAVGLVVDAAGVPGVDLLNGAGSFDSAAGWNINAGWAISNGVANFSGGSAANINRSLQSLANRMYSIRFEIKNYVAGSVFLQLNNPGASASPAFSGNGVKFAYILAATNYANVSIVAATGSNLSVDDVVVRELPGIHATQATSQNKPALRRGIVNQLLWSSDFSQSAWAKHNCLIQSGGKIVANTGTTRANVRQGSLTVGNTIAAIVSAAEWNRACIGVSNNSGLWSVVNFNLTSAAAEAVTTYGSCLVSNPTITSLGDGRYLCIVRVAALAGGETACIMPFNQSGDPVNPSPSLTGNGTSGIFLHSAALFQGTVTAEQILAAGGIPVTTTAPASSALGPFFWRFDPIDDALLMTFPTGAGWNNTTIITGRATGQVTQTAQNVQGAHSITGGGDMYGRCYVANGSNLSASELATLQRFMNTIAGVA